MVCSKLDKIDKIFISLTLIIVTMFSIFNCFCFASEDENVSVSFVQDLRMNFTTKKFETRQGDVVAYFQVEKGYKYFVKFSSTVQRNFVLSSDYPSNGVSFEVYQTVSAGNDIVLEYVANDNAFLFMTYNGQSRFEVVRQPLLGFQGAIDKLTQDVGLTNIWFSFDKSLPFVLVVVLLSFGFWFFSHWVKELSKGREF